MIHCERQSHLLLRAILFGSYFIHVDRYGYTYLNTCCGIDRINSLNVMSNEAIHSGLAD